MSKPTFFLRPPPPTGRDVETRVADNLTKARVSRDPPVSQSDLARLTGCSRSHISLIERGLVTPSLRTIERLAQALAIPLTTLIQEDPLS